MMKDHGLVKLLELRGSHFPDIDIALLKQVYQVQKIHYFDDDQGPALKKVREIVESYVDRELAGPTS
jgi:hypothetical protein